MLEQPMEEDGGYEQLNNKIEQMINFNSKKDERMSE